MSLSIGKLPPDLLARILARAPTPDPRVLVRAGLGLDCAVVETPGSETLLVFKSDPITFATDEIGWYLVHVNANDLATTGATPRWLLVTMLLPESSATPDLVEQINAQVWRACQALGIAVIGGHTEVTAGLERPILAGTLIGEAARERLVTPRGARPGDRVLLTKGVPIEATALLAREFADRLRPALSEAALAEARAFLHTPGLSVLHDAQIALQAGAVTAMHDPTEGGLAAALWELAEASGRALMVDPAAVPVPALSARLCRALNVDPLAAIASGALLLTTPPADAGAIQRALEAEGIACAELGEVTPGPPAVRGPDGRPWPWPERDAIAALYG